jgi:WD40 repeat protein
MQDLETDTINTESNSQPSSTGNSSSSSGNGNGTPNRGIWALEISRCGRYLAASGQDHIVRVWCLATAETNQYLNKNLQQSATRSTGEQSGLHRARSRRGTMGLARRNEIFCQRPMRTWIGHKNDVLELAWSKVSFSIINI